MKISIIIPVYNEVGTIQDILSRVQKINIDKEIIIVDDGSTDGTAEILKQITNDGNVSVIIKNRNSGKGHSLKIGIQKAAGDYIIIQDADNEYDPCDFLKLIAALEDKEAEVIYGSRFMQSTSDSGYAAHYYANKLLTKFTNILYGSKLTDMETCYKLIPNSFAKSINIDSKKFNFEPEITAKIIKAGLRIKEVPISYNGRKYSEGKKIKWHDFFDALFTLIKYKFY